MDCRDDLTSVDMDHSVVTESLASATSSSTISLYPFIDHHGCYGTNLALPDSLPRVLRPWDSKDVCTANDELGEPDDALNPRSGGPWTGGSIDSQDDDDELLVHVKFTELVKIKSMLIGTGGGRASNAPRLLKCWVNRVDGLTFSDVNSTATSQEFELLESTSGSHDSLEYPVRLARFSNVSTIDLYFANTRGGESSRLYYLGFMGESRRIKKEENSGMTVGAETGVDSMIDRMKESKPSGGAPVR
ncbi:BZ3500_MvSof-1268-A1-R1_Chr6-3g08702 [Microbotryum saponariae]|uniref:BZ3500_MvSof-1268-A1-R1_Chr6-3g08702 protein n=1 Tax=Microbotryum saponariae TaxID=289078 RepID=A0A2X0MH28_9BASI|nr:BZ3500_MvSof-1268-A1-R1_Chr6-3g08702 [Microbotryum saponariae]SDA07303.1 BZ3501_MvSof-1269-A2-R1_Chr6-2g08405 [Microbotryum saponariae]